MCSAFLECLNFDCINFPPFFAHFVKPRLVKTHFVQLRFSVDLIFYELSLKCYLSVDCYIQTLSYRDLLHSVCLRLCLHPNPFMSCIYDLFFIIIFNFIAVNHIIILVPETTLLFCDPFDLLRCLKYVFHRSCLFHFISFIKRSCSTVSLLW